MRDRQTPSDPPYIHPSSCRELFQNADAKWVCRVACSRKTSVWSPPQEPLSVHNISSMPSLTFVHTHISLLPCHTWAWESGLQTMYIFTAKHFQRLGKHQAAAVTPNVPSVLRQDKLHLQQPSCLTPPGWKAVGRVEVEAYSFVAPCLLIIYIKLTFGEFTLGSVIVFFRQFCIANRENGILSTLTNF